MHSAVTERHPEGTRQEAAELQERARTAGLLRFGTRVVQMHEGPNRAERRREAARMRQWVRRQAKVRHG